MTFFSRLLALCGCVMAILPLFYGENYVVVIGTVVLVAGMWAARGKVCRLLHWVNAHAGCVVAVVLAVGLLARVLIGVVWHYWINAEPQYSPWSDSFVFWEQAKQLASGAWPESKSWTTVCFYGGLIKVFGINAKILVIANMFVQCATMFILFSIGRKMVCNGSAIVASMLYFLSPGIMFNSFSLLSEHLYFLMVAIVVSLSVRCVGVRDLRHMILLWAGMCVTIWLATWSRAEGVVLWMAATVPVLVALAKVWRFKHIAWMVLCVICVFLLGAFGGKRVNQDHQSFFCSSDSWWPRLHGSCVEADGRFGGGSKQVYELAMRQYPDREFEYQLGYCPSELVPIIKSEISRRWHEMDMLTMMRFIVKKELWDFGGERISFVKKTKMLKWASLLINEAVPILIAVLSLVYFLQVLAGRCTLPERCWSPLLVVLGTACVLAVAESQPRYGLVMELMFALYAASSLKMFVRCRTRSDVAH